MNNLVNQLSLGKILKKYNLNTPNKKQLFLLSKWETAISSGLHIKSRKLKFQQTLTQQ